MDFTFTEEHEELRRTVRKFLDNESHEQAVRTVMATESGYDERAWKRLSEELALTGLIVPEEHGGVGMSYVELAVVLEEMGRALLCAPYLSTAVLSVNTLLSAGDEPTQADLLARIAAGQTIVSVAIAEENGRWDLDGVQARATADNDQWRLDGVKSYVIDGHTADVLLVAACAPDGLSLFRVESDTAGLSRSVLPTLDLTRKLARVELSSAPAQRVGGETDVTEGLERALALTVAALAAEQSGGAQRCLEMSTEYAKTRLQFGRPIGSFQAIKHRCADMLVEVELAKTAAYQAAFSIAQEEEEDLARVASLAKAYCSEAYVHAANETIQVHGGMGFTWEHPAHLYLKRAKSSGLLFGTPEYHRERLAEQVGI